MPTTFTPTPVALSTLTLPADGDPRTAASVNSPFGALANAIAYLTNHNVILSLNENMGTGPGGGPSAAAFLAPADSVAMLVEMWGGGGAGGQGGGSGITLLTGSTGGGAGGGARARHTILPVVGGDVYSSFVAAPAAMQADGGDSILYHAGTEIARAKGAGRGLDGGIGLFTASHFNGTGIPDTLDTYYGFTPGGADAAPTGGPGPGAGFPLAFFLPYYGINMPRIAQHGGYGLNYWAGGANRGFHGNGGSSPEGFAGGSAGVEGAKIGTTIMGGGGGGGGGAGPNGQGADGGNGSNGVVSGTPSTPGNGGNAAGGSGGGGGGGGGAGSTDAGSTPLLHGGLPGQGGSGCVRVWFLRKAP